MYQVPQITDSVYYVGVNDRMKERFENVWSIPSGVAYNAYLIVDEKTTLIDTVDVCYSDIFFHKLDLILQGRPVDYLIINHMEPDHGGSIGLLRSASPLLTSWRPVVMPWKPRVLLPDGSYGTLARGDVHLRAVQPPPLLC